MKIVTLLLVASVPYTRMFGLGKLRTKGMATKGPVTKGLANKGLRSTYIGVFVHLPIR